MPWVLPLAASALAGPDLDAFVTRADRAFAGPMGCFVAMGEAGWTHTSGRWSAGGAAAVEARFDHRVWRVDRFDHPEVQLAPMLLGTGSASPLAYPESRRRDFEWPAPVVTIPMRSWGDVGTLSLDELVDGARVVVQSFEWRGYKRAEGARRAEIDPEGQVVSVSIDVTERGPDGCRVHSSGTAALDERGLPTSERWTFEGRCPLRSWTRAWTFTWGPWAPCSRSGP